MGQAYLSTKLISLDNQLFRHLCLDIIGKPPNLTGQALEFWASISVELKGRLYLTTIKYHAINLYP